MVMGSGPFYHFASKTALLVELAREQLAAFRESVLEQVDSDEQPRGRLTRAYVRACLLAVDADEMRERYALITQLLVVPEVLELAEEDERRWVADLSADGVPRLAQLLVLAAADGIGGPPLWTTTMTPAERDALRDDLIAMVDGAIRG